MAEADIPSLQETFWRAVVSYIWSLSGVRRERCARPPEVTRSMKRYPAIATRKDRRLTKNTMAPTGIAILNMNGANGPA